MRAPVGTVAMRWSVCCGSQCLVLAGYEDVNDAERLRHDPAMRWTGVAQRLKAARLRRARWAASRRSGSRQR